MCQSKFFLKWARWLFGGYMGEPKRVKTSWSPGLTSFYELFKGTLKGSLWPLVFLSLALVLLNAGVLLVLGPLLSHLLGFHPGEHLTLVGVFPFLAPFFPASFSSHTLSYSTLSWLAALCLAVLGFMRSWSYHRLLMVQYSLVLKVAHGFRLRLFAAIIESDYHLIQRRSVSAWMSVVVHDVHALSERLSDFLKNILKESALLLGVLVSLLWVHPLFALMMIVIAIPVFLYGYGAGSWISHRVKAQRLILAKMSTVVRYLSQHFLFIKVSKGEPCFKETWNKMVQAYFSYFAKIIPVKSLLRPSLELLAIIFLSAVLFGYQSLEEDLGWSQQSLFQLFLSIGVMMRPLKSLGDQLAYLGDLKGLAAQSLQILSESSSSSSLTVSAPEASLAPSWCLQGLNVAFPQSSVLWAKPLAPFTLKTRSVVGVVGVSGAGKSLWLKTLAGLYPPARVLSREDFLAQTSQSSYVPQFPFLFPGTVAQNLRYPATLWDEKVLIEHLRELGLVKSEGEGESFLKRQVFLASSPALSQGQLQRIVILREALRGKTWQLFDEASSALSSDDELKVLMYLKGQCVEKSVGVVWVTHRWSGLSLCDEVWQMIPGKGLKNIGKISSHKQARELMASISGDFWEHST